MPKQTRQSSCIRHTASLQKSSKSLERVCDHAVNISKETVFMATSRDVRHAPEFKKPALRKELE
jgi:phosphate uptake regulator